jgi:alkylation response protein AidB-like acyl-CoA dehydrogenase
MLEPQLLEQLAAHAEEADRRFDWPEASWRLLADTGVPGWSIPREYGGSGLDPVATLRGHEALGSACMTTAFILSQCEAAIQRILSGESALLRERVLPSVAQGKSFVTIGISHLTTSRQHLAPSLRAEPLGPVDRPEAFRLDGEAPWVSGADHAAAVVIGATLPDRLQTLFVLPTDRPGVSITPPLDLSALCGSRTSLVQCRGVTLEREWLLAGPSPNVLSRGAGGLETSCLALGLSRSAIDFLQRESRHRPELLLLAERFEKAWSAGRSRLHELAQTSGDPNQAHALRIEATRLVLRATESALAAAKGAGFVSPHPAQRWARQALFFLVWSLPRPAAEAILDDLARL